MIIDFEESLENFTFDADVTVVGTGPAGMSVALGLEDCGVSVNLLEGGGKEFESSSQAIYRGQIEGKSYYDLDASRIRMLGGTSTHWAGNCRELSPIDFEAREWVANSGWPISYEDVKPYYIKATEFLKISADKSNITENWESQHLPSPIHTDMSEIWVTQFSPLSYDTSSFVALNFGKEYAGRIDISRKVNLFLHANVTAIKLDSSGSNVECIEVKSLGGNQARFRSKYYVIAMGGIENARIMLASNKQLKEGIGNKFDNVGRYFMEHIEVDIGNVIPSHLNSISYDMFSIPQSRLNSFSREQYRTQSYYTFSDALQCEKRLLSTSLSMWRHNQWFYKSREPVKSLRAIIDGIKAPTNGLINAEFAYHLRNVFVGIDQVYRGVKESLLPSDGPVELFGCGIQAEQEPQRKNRVSLISEKDALDVPKVKLHWALSDNDLASVRAVTSLFARELGAAGVGRLQSAIPKADDELSEKINGAWHHMGTTRMSTNPEDGVVDSDCKVFGVNNLFVAGSSVFSTGGHSVPTFTIVALALRLAEHLKGKLHD